VFTGSGKDAFTIQGYCLIHTDKAVGSA